MKKDVRGLAAVASALPSMQHLSHLQLGGKFAQDAVLRSVQHLPRLQVLLLDDSDCSNAALAELPQSLTWLKLDVGTGSVTLSHSSTPGLTKLTALQRLEVSRATDVHPALLGCFTRLQHLCIEAIELLKAAGELGLAAFSTLTALQHLELRLHDPDDRVAATQADCAALTASSQLTFLFIGNGQKGVVADEKYIHVFQQGCRLPHLREL